MSKIYHNEHGYIEMIRDVLHEGYKTPDRTGVGCIKVFDRKVIYDVGDTFPFSTIRPAPLRMAFEEFWMFMRGETDTKYLESKKINFWKGNTSREFLDNRGLTHLPEGDMGKAYGYQWRKYNHIPITGLNGIDQLKDTYNTLMNDPYSRRIYTTFWNPAQSHEMALTPCWHSHQFNVMPNEYGSKTLNMKLINRSLDSVFGLSFAVQQYALYLVGMAQLTGMRVGTLSCDLTDVHIYMNQIDFALELVEREFGIPGSVSFKKPLNELDDLINLTWEDIHVEGLYVNKTPFVNETPSMAV